MKRLIGIAVIVVLVGTSLISSITGASASIADTSIPDIAEADANVSYPVNMDAIEGIYALDSVAKEQVLTDRRTCNVTTDRLTLATVEVTAPTTWYVDDDLVDYPDADFTKIQDAVDAASGGDTIIVYPGTYIENVDVNKEHLTIESESGTEVTIVQAANSNDSVFEVTVDYVNISGFTVKNATKSCGIDLEYADDSNITNNTALSNGHGIYLFGSDKNNITNNTALNNSGNGIYLSGSNNNDIADNSASNNQYGIYLHGSSNNDITNNTASTNSFGIYLTGSSNSNNVVNNTATLNHTFYGIFLIYSSNNNITNNTVLNNGHGIAVYDSSNNIIYLNNFTNNPQNGYSSRLTSIWSSPEEITYTYNGNTFTSYLGNYWSDYEEKYPQAEEVDGTGIWDTLYEIPGEAGDKDNYPLVEPFENYEIGPSPKTWYVDDDLVDYPDADFTKIQDAVAAASPEDTIIVYPGTYTENVDVNKDHLTIQSENGAETTIVQAAYPCGNVFEVTADYVDISGFRVQGATWIEKVGIYLREVVCCNITNNIVSNNRGGIYLIDSNNNDITDNSASNNRYGGIYLHRSSNNDITNNTASDNLYGWGIDLSFSSNNNITNNNISNNSRGISLRHSNNSTITNNSFINDGLFVDGCYQNTVEGNTVNGKPLVYLEDVSEFAVTDAGQVILVNCNNIIVEDLDLSDTTCGIELWGTNNSKITSNTLSNNNYGIYLGSSSNNDITNNTALNNSGGIDLQYSHHNSIANNTGDSNNNWSIRLYHSNNNDITNNTASNNNYGIQLFDSSHNNVTNNNASNNRVGIALYFLTNTKVTNNTASNNNNGILLSGATNSVIYLNNFINNTDNVDSYGSSNMWNSPEEMAYTYNDKCYTNYLGNHWGNYLGGDVDGDGIGDAPYSIDSDKDNYPLVEPFENYETIENQPPYAPNSPTPSNHSIDVSIDADLSWIGGDSDAGDTVTYDVYFGTSASPPLVSNDQVATSYDSGTLNNNTKYYWKIVATDNHDASTSGPVWDFTTVPTTPTVPTVTTDAATLVEETEATLNGTLEDDGGEACQYRFEYDTDSGEPYAYNTTWTGCKTTGESFSEAISGLAQGTVYYFRAQAKNSAGTGSGSEETFLTKPEAPTGFSASAINATQIDLSWTKGVGAEKTKIIMKIGSYPADRTDGTEVYFDTGNSTADTGLIPGVTYYYSAWSYVQGSEQWSDVCAQASPLPDPGWFMWLDVYPEASGYIKVNGDMPESYPAVSEIFDWDAWVELEAIPAEGYTFIEWCGDVSGTDNPIIVVGGSQVEGYQKEVSAISEAAPKCMVVSVGAIFAPALSNPSPPNHATGVAIDADLSWTGGDPDVGDTVTYDVYFGTSASPPLVSNEQVATTYDPGTLSYNTTYYWKIVATDNHGTSVDGPVWDFTTRPTGAPTTVVIDPATWIVVMAWPFTLDVLVTPGEAIAGAQCDIGFDSSWLAVNAVTEGNLLTQEGASSCFNPGTIDNTAGSVSGISGTITTPGATVSDQGVFATITFRVHGIFTTIDCESPITLANVIVADINGDPVAVDVTNGRVWVTTPLGMLVRIGQHFGETGTPGWIPEDVKVDGVINVQDMVVIGQHWWTG